MSTDPDHPDTPAPEELEQQLVAYLDGELDEASARRMEELLASDSRAREILRRLQQAWDALDQLDRSGVDETFTQTTLEKAAAAAEDEVRRLEDEAPRRRRRRWLAGTLGLVASAAAGFLAVAKMWPDPNAALLRDLPVLENLDPYRQIDDVEFLRMLHRERVFAQEANHERP